MIDLKLLRNNFDLIEKKNLNKDPSFPIRELYEKDKFLINKKIELDEKLFEINNISKKFSANKGFEELKKNLLK